ncbi:MAG: Rieske 2Fe-2S domain-containing protein [Symploca sp. SIO1A3]|nr:Rieske 2Fe-2S domain-containing protein [Symploca sp. SIO1A3]
MTIAYNKPETEQPVLTSPIPEVRDEFNWKQCWYPVAFVQDLPKNRPYGFSLYDEAFVLFRNQDGKLGCLTDLCPHRAAKLSDGQIMDGKIECLYHGWQFNTDGQCLHIPQLPTDAKMTARACVRDFTVVERQGIVWMWRGNPETAQEENIPILEQLEDPKFFSLDYMIDLPLDQGSVIENVIDPAHIPISHHGTMSDRKYAQPLEMEVSSVSAKGIKGRYRKTSVGSPQWIDLDFVAPSLVVYKDFFASENGSRASTALYCLPLGKGQCRLLLRIYQNFSTWKLKLQPRWLEHLFRHLVLEDDLKLLEGQQMQLESLGKSIKELYLPLKTSDVLVMEYRKWLDTYGSSLPYYQGYATSKPEGVREDFSPPPSPGSRFSYHTQICSSCSGAYRVTQRAKSTLVGVAIVLAALAILSDTFWISLVAVSASLSSVALAFAAHKLKTKFE